MRLVANLRKLLITYKVHFQLLIHIVNTQVLSLVVDALAHDNANVRVAACICLRSNSRSIKVCNVKPHMTLEFFMSCILNFHKMSFRIWVQDVLWTKALWFLWFGFCLIFLLLSRYLFIVSIMFLWLKLELNWAVVGFMHQKA